MVKKLRSVARGCLWKHLIFSFRGDLNEDYPMAMVSYGTIFRINKIDSTSLPVIREWIRKHAKIGAAGEGRVFGDGTYTLLQVHTADIVTEIEDSELCPGNDTIDATKFNYFDLPQTWSPIQTPTQQPTPVKSDDVIDQSQVGNPNRATIQEILNRHNSLAPSTEAVLPSSTARVAPTQTPTHTIPVVEILDQGQDLETVLPTEKVTTLIPVKNASPSTKIVTTSTKTISTTSTTSTPTSKMHIILAEGKTIGPTTTTLSSDEPEEIVPVEPEAREEDVLEQVEDVPTTILPTTISSTPRLIVGTPPAETAVPSPIYSLDDHYDGALYQINDGFGDEEVDLEVAKQETLVEIKKSESFWAFLSCAVLIIGKSVLRNLIGQNINGIFRFIIGCI